MRNTKLLVVVCLLSLFTLSGCDEDIFTAKDCSTIGLLLDITHTVGSDERTVNFSISYSGEYTLESSVEWDFGDGTMQNLSGTSAQHTYGASGSFTASAKVTLSGSSIGSCPKTIVEQVVL